MTRHLVAFALVVAAAGCTDRLTAPGQCPDFCPTGQIVVVDTVLGDVAERDSAFRGYLQPHEAGVMLAADLAGLDSRPVLETGPLAARIRIGNDTTTGAVVGVDSARITITVLRRDTSARGTTLSLYRLPLGLDSTTTFADLAADFGAPPLRRVALDSLIALPGHRDTLTGDSVSVDSSGVVTLLLRFDSTALGYTAADSAKLALGVRVAADTMAAPGRASLGIGASTAGILVTWFAKVDSLGFATVKRGLVTQARFHSYVFDPPAAPLDSALAVGGAPSARSLLRLRIPRQLRDSAQIVRATLILVPVKPALGSPADSFRVIAQVISADLGAKSPLGGPLFATDQTFFGAATVRPASLDTVRIEVGGPLRRWQVDTNAATALILRADPEGGVPGEISFAASRFAGLRPALQVTYIPRYPFGVP